VEEQLDDKKGGLTMTAVEEFYLKQCQLLTALEKELAEEIKRYSECYEKGKMNDYVFDLRRPVSLEELPLILTSFGDRTDLFGSNWFLNKKKDRIKSLEKVEERIGSLGMKPLPRTPEFEEWVNSPGEF
jgi:hypothetical protein